MARKKTETSENLVRETMRQHDQSMWIVAEVEACLEGKPDAEGHWAAELVEKLSQLGVALRSHFRDEEKGSLYSDLPDRQPRFAERLAELRSEHKRMLEMTRVTIDQANSLQHGAADQTVRLKALVRLLLATIERHEAAENELVMEAHWEEIEVTN